MVHLLNILDIFFNLLSVSVFIRILMSWFRISHHDNPLVRFIYQITEPILDFARRITPRTGMIDFSPLVAIIGLDLIRYFLMGILSGM